MVVMNDRIFSAKQEAERDYLNDVKTNEYGKIIYLNNW